MKASVNLVGLELNKKIEVFKEWLKSYHTGSFVKIVTVKSLGNGIEKRTEAVIRLGIKYANIKGVTPSDNGKKKTDNNEVIIKNVLKHNTNTNNYNLTIYTTKHKAKVKYYMNGEEVEKATIESMIKERPLQEGTKLYTKNLNDIIQIG